MEQMNNSDSRSTLRCKNPKRFVWIVGIKVDLSQVLLDLGPLPCKSFPFVQGRQHRTVPVVRNSLKGVLKLGVC